jgi:hypothetical protein
MISESQQIELSVPLDAIEHHANNIDMPRIDSLIRKGSNRRTHGAARHGK